MSGETNVVEQIAHYQRKIERYTANDEGDKLLYCIHKLKYLPVTVSHLEETGVGRDVNALRHRDGLLGEKARALVNKWKEMVTAEEEEEEEEEEDEGETIEDKRPEFCMPDNLDEEKWDQLSENENDRLQIEEGLGDVEHESFDLVNSGGYGTHEPIETDEEYDGYNPITAKEDYLNVTNNKTHPQEYIPSVSSQINKYDELPSSGNGSPQQEYKPTNISRDAAESMSLSSPGKKSRSDKEREKDSKERHKSKNKEKDRDREREKSKEKTKSSKSQEKEKKDKYKDRDKDREKSHKHQHKDRDRDKEKEKEKERDKEKDKESEKKKEKSEGNSVEKSKSDVINGFSAKDSGDKKKSSDKKEGDDKRKESKDLSSTTRENDKKSESRHSDKHSDRHSDKYIEKSSDKYIEKSSDKYNDKHSDKYKSGESSHRGADSRQSSGADVKKSSRKDHDSENKDKKENVDRKEDSDKKNKERSSDREKDKDKKKKSRRSSPDPFEQALLGAMDSSQKKKKKKKKEKDNERVESDKANTPSTSKKRSLSPQSVTQPDPKKPRLLNMNPAKLPSLPDVDVLSEASLLPEISSNYRPLPRVNFKEEPLAHSKLSEEELLSQMMSSKSNRQRKLYSGNVKGLSHVPTLYDSCIRCLQENIESLEATGGIPYDILKPVLERCTWQQLFRLENYNAYLLDDSDVLWENFCRKDFRTKKKLELETYREMYLRCFDEREVKLRSLTETLQQKKINKAHAASSTKMAFVGQQAKAPKSVMRAQAKWGTNISPTKPTKPASTFSTSSSSTSGISAMKDVREDVAARKQAMENVIRTERAQQPKLTQAQKKRKMAPMMAKTKMFYKKAFRR